MNQNFSSFFGNCNATQFNVTVPTEFDVAYTTLEIICAVLSIVGNSVIIFLFIKKRSLRTVKNCYVISLASADLLVGLIGVPSAITVAVGLPRDFHACLFMTSVLMLLCTASILSLGAITVDRFWSIMKPLTYPATMTHNVARTIIFIVWCLSTIIGLLPLFGWNQGRPPAPRCFFLEIMDLRYLVFIYFGTIITPSLFMVVVYSVIFYEVRKQGYQHHQYQDDRVLRRHMTVSVKMVKSIAMIFVFFLIAWLPLYTINTIIYFQPCVYIPSELMKTIIILSHLNSVWNPIIYGCRMKDFRKALQKYLCGIQAMDSSGGMTY